eukprot:jgi/Botrbrau1/3311/Bobra.0048s0008.1
MSQDGLIKNSTLDTGVESPYASVYGKKRSFGQLEGQQITTDLMQGPVIPAPPLQPLAQQGQLAHASPAMHPQEPASPANPAGISGVRPNQAPTVGESRRGHSGSRASFWPPHGWEFLFPVPWLTGDSGRSKHRSNHKAPADAVFFKGNTSQAFNHSAAGRPSASEVQMPMSASVQHKEVGSWPVGSDKDVHNPPFDPAFQTP